MRRPTLMLAVMALALSACGTRVDPAPTTGEAGVVSAEVCAAAGRLADWASAVPGAMQAYEVDGLDAAFALAEDADLVLGTFPDDPATVTLAGALRAYREVLQGLGVEQGMGRQALAEVEAEAAALLPARLLAAAPALATDGRVVDAPADLDGCEGTGVRAALPAVSRAVGEVAPDVLVETSPGLGLAESLAGASEDDRVVEPELCTRVSDTPTGRFFPLVGTAGVALGCEVGVDLDDAAATAEMLAVVGSREVAALLRRAPEPPTATTVAGRPALLLPGTAAEPGRPHLVVPLDDGTVLFARAGGEAAVVAAVEAALAGLSG